MTIRVVIADDQSMVRAGFRSLLNDEPDIEVVGEAADGEQAVAAVRRFKPDVALMDIRMPNVDGLEATRRLIEGGSEARVLILTTFDLDEYVYEGLQVGASGFLLKDASPEQLIAAIHVIAEGEAVLAPSVTRRVVERFAQLPARRDESSTALATLTTREREVLKLLARGLANAEIAAELVVSGATAKTHVRNVLTKLALRDRVQAVIFAYEVGLVQPGDAETAPPP
ncbi:MAG: response regulator transcription factor [Thermoleophilaceae bacterium]